MKIQTAGDIANWQSWVALAHGQRVIRAGYVYLLRSRISPGLYKIGQTADVDKRVRAINRAHPVGLVKSIHCDDMYMAERFFHNCFFAQQIADTEWFHLGRAEVEAFCAYDTWWLSDHVAPVERALLEINR